MGVSLTRLPCCRFGDSVALPVAAAPVRGADAPLSLDPLAGWLVLHWGPRGGGLSRELHLAPAEACDGRLLALGGAPTPRCYWSALPRRQRHGCGRKGALFYFFFIWGRLPLPCGCLTPSRCRPGHSWQWRHGGKGGCRCGSRLLSTTPLPNAAIYIAASGGGARGRDGGSRWWPRRPWPGRQVRPLVGQWPLSRLRPARGGHGVGGVAPPVSSWPTAPPPQRRHPRGVCGGAPSTPAPPWARRREGARGGMWDWGGGDGGLVFGGAKWRRSPAEWCHRSHHWWLLRRRRGGCFIAAGKRNGGGVGARACHFTHNMIFKDADAGTDTLRPPRLQGGLSSWGQAREAYFLISLHWRARWGARSRTRCRPSSPHPHYFSGSPL